jgi:hypothetical protein
MNSHFHDDQAASLLPVSSPLPVQAAQQRPVYPLLCIASLAPSWLLPLLLLPIHCPTCCCTFFSNTHVFAHSTQQGHEFWCSLSC